MPEIIRLYYTGFIEVLDSDTMKDHKMYIELFTCAVTRAWN